MSDLLPLMFTKVLHQTLNVYNSCYAFRENAQCEIGVKSNLDRSVCGDKISCIKMIWCDA